MTLGRVAQCERDRLPYLRAQRKGMIMFAVTSQGWGFAECLILRYDLHLLLPIEVDFFRYPVCMPLSKSDVGSNAYARPSVD